MGGWATAQSPILGTTITLERLKKRGYISLLEIFLKVSPKFNEPLYTRPVASILKLRRKHTYSGVRGSPLGFSLAAAYSISKSTLLIICN